MIHSAISDASWNVCSNLCVNKWTQWHSEIVRGGDKTLMEVLNHERMRRYQYWHPDVFVRIIHSTFVVLLDETSGRVKHLEAANITINWHIHL